MFYIENSELDGMQWEREGEGGKKGQRADSKAVAVTAGNWRNFAEGKLAVVIKSGLILAEFPRPFFPERALLREPPAPSLYSRVRPSPQGTTMGECSAVGRMKL